MIFASSKPSEPTFTVGLLPPPVEQAPATTTSASIDAPRASVRDNRMGLLLAVGRRSPASLPPYQGSLPKPVRIVRPVSLQPAAPAPTSGIPRSVAESPPAAPSPRGVRTRARSAN